MNPKEIRLGNYVNVPREDQCPFRIDLIEHLTESYAKVGMEILKSTHPLTWYLQDLSPIKLTAKWLYTFGFKDAPLTDPYGGYLSPLHDRTRLRIKVNEEGKYGFYNDPDFIELSVHELQNLWFDLTKTELDGYEE